MDGDGEAAIGNSVCISKTKIQIQLYSFNLTLYKTILILPAPGSFLNNQGPLIPDWFGESILPVNHMCVHSGIIAPLSA